MFGRVPMQHTVTGEGDPASIYHDDVLDGWNTQASTQWDGFRHIPHPVHRFYGGLDEKDHGVDHWAERGIVGRGVLADVGRWLEADGRPLALDQPVPIDPEDVVALPRRRGRRVRARRRPADPHRLVRVVPRPVGGGEGGDGRAARQPRPAARVATARTLWDLHIAAVAADNPAVEVWPPGAISSPEDLQAAMEDRSTMPEIFVHTALIPLLGIPLGEFFVLDALAEDCARDGRYVFLFTSSPLHLTRGVASPPNALAIK